MGKSLLSTLSCIKQLSHFRQEVSMDPAPQEREQSSPRDNPMGQADNAFKVVGGRNRCEVTPSREGP